MSNANEESLKYKKFLRKYVRTKITKKTNQIQSDVSIYDSDELNKHLDELDLLHKEIMELDSEVKKLLFHSSPNEAEFTEECETCDNYIIKLSDARRLLKGKLQPSVQTTILNSPVGEGSQESHFNLSNVN